MMRKIVMRLCTHHPVHSQCGDDDDDAHTHSHTHTLHSLHSAVSARTPAYCRAQAVFHGKGKAEAAPQQLDKYTRELLQTTNTSAAAGAAGAAASPAVSKVLIHQRSTKASVAAKAAAEASDGYEAGACSRCGQPGHNKLSCPHNLLRGGP